MKIVIAGAGSIGTVIGVLLAKDHDVELLRRSGTYGRYEISIVGVVDEKEEVEVLNSHDLGMRNVDMIILTTQRQQSEILLNIIEKKYNTNENTIFLCMQNGMHVSKPVKSRFPDANIIQGVIWWSATLLEDNKVYYHRAAPTYIGNIQGSALTKVISLLKPYFELIEVDDIYSEVRTKLLLNVVSPVLALVKKPYPNGLNDLRIREIVHIAFDDVLEIAKTLGWVIDDKLNDFHKILKSKDKIPTEDTKLTHKVSTQISAEKHGGSRSNVGSLLSYFIMHGSNASNIILGYVSDLEPGYDAISDGKIKRLHSSLNRLTVKCSI